MKHLKSLLPLLLALFCWACNEDEPFFEQTFTDNGAHTYGIVTQGNFYSGIAGDISVLQYDDSFSSSIVDYRSTTIGSALGDTPQAPCLYGATLYVPLTESNLVLALDPVTMYEKGRMRATMPEGVCGAGGKIFVTCNDGYVQSFDTLQYKPAMAERVAVGPNPMGICADADRIYVAISDGYNGWEAGKRVAVLDARTGQRLYDVACGLNPVQVLTDEAGRLFIACQGNYYDVPAQIYVCEKGAQTATPLCDGSLMAQGAGKLFVVNNVTDWKTYTSTVTFSTFSLTSTAITPDAAPEKALTLPAAPIAMYYDAEYDNLFITSDKSPASYSENGVVYFYREALKNNFSMMAQYDCGVHPCGMYRIK